MKQGGFDFEGAEKATEHLISLLPERIAGELIALSYGQSRFYERLEELRLRAEGRSSLMIGGRQRYLSGVLDLKEMDDLLLRLCCGSRYAYEECILEGYLPMEGGVRVGVCGRARYERELLMGVCEVRSLVFRFPHAVDMALGRVLLDAFLRARRGLLIYSPPGGGKTTALRALALALGTKKEPCRVVVLDERMEFPLSEYASATVDILRGYRRVHALAIAHRSMSPEVVMLDEVGGEEEAEALSSLLRGGAATVCTAHAKSYEDICSRGALRPFLERGIFDAFLCIKRNKNGFVYRVENVEDEEEIISECSVVLA